MWSRGETGDGGGGGGYIAAQLWVVLFPNNPQSDLV